MVILPCRLLIVRAAAKEAKTAIRTERSCMSLNFQMIRLKFEKKMKNILYNSLWWKSFLRLLFIDWIWRNLGLAQTIRSGRLKFAFEMNDDWLRHIYFIEWPRKKKYGEKFTLCGVFFLSCRAFFERFFCAIFDDKRSFPGRKVYSRIVFFN